MLEKFIDIVILLAIVFVVVEVYNYHTGARVGVGVGTKERFVNQIDEKKYIQIATAIENVVTLDGDLDSFKKETKLTNFDPDLYNELIKQRNQARKKLDVIGVKVVFARVGKEKSLKSVK